MLTITEPARSIPVIAEADLCVVGGSCTGVFAAVRAARLGLNVVIVEAHNCFGGVATNAMVNIWHSLHDVHGNQQIIAGLTEEVIDRLRTRDAVNIKETITPNKQHENYVLNTEELKIELDHLIKSHSIHAYLHTVFAAPYINPQTQQLEGIIVENKDGRGAILAKVFVDATGDGDVAARLNLPTYTSDHQQPGTTCAKISKLQTAPNFSELYRAHRHEYDLPETFIWSSLVPGQQDVYMLAASRVAMNMSNAAQLTKGEMEGRRQVRAMMDMMRAHHPQCEVALMQLPSRIGVRETRHVRALHQIEGKVLLSQGRYDDAIANGTYESDLHHQDKSGITFRFLNGEQRLSRPGQQSVVSRWREPQEPEPTFYQIPFRAMIPRNNTYPNLIMAGRMIDADEMAHGAIRVMVNMNQVGEAAGVASYLALHRGQSYRELSADAVRAELKKGGSLVI